MIINFQNAQNSVWLSGQKNLNNLAAARNCRAQNIRCEACGKRQYKTVCINQSKQAKEVKVTKSSPADTVVSVFLSNSEGNAILFLPTAAGYMPLDQANSLSVYWMGKSA